MNGTKPSPLGILKKDIREYAPGILTAALVFTVVHKICGTICPVRILFGLPCPACGVTRAVQCLLRGDLAGSFSYQPLLPLILLVFPFFIVSHYFFQKSLPFLEKYVIIVLSMMILLYLFRMLTQFGTEPIRFYEENCLFCRLAEWLKTLSEES